MAKQIKKTDATPEAPEQITEATPEVAKTTPVVSADPQPHEVLNRVLGWPLFVAQKRLEGSEVGKDLVEAYKAGHVAMIHAIASGLIKHPE